MTIFIYPQHIVEKLNKDLMLITLKVMIIKIKI